MEGAVGAPGGTDWLCLGERDNEDLFEKVTAKLGFAGVDSGYSGRVGRVEVHLRQRK